MQAGLLGGRGNWGFICTKKIMSTLMVNASPVLIILILLGRMPTFMVNAFREEKMQFTVVSGKDESEEKEALLLDKFRVLLGIRSHETKEMFGSPSPAPSPAETESEAPSPAPIMQPIPLHLRRHHRPPHLRVSLPHHKIKGHNEERKRARRILLVALLVSLGVTLVILGVGFVWFVKHYYRRRKRCVTNVSVSQDAAGNDKGNRNDPSFDLFYLNTLAGVLEPQTIVEERSDPGSSSSSTVNKEEDQNEDGVNRSNSSSNEVAVCADGQGDQISTRIQSRSSGDESFHSICESNASHNARLSNVSTSSFSDAMEGFSPSPKVLNVSSPQYQFTAQKPSNSPKHPTIEKQHSQNLQHSTNSKPPTPPPPPPPPPVSTIHSSLIKLKANKSPSFSTLQNPPTSESPSSSSRSNETLASDILASGKASIPPKPPFRVPTPPCPPSSDSPGSSSRSDETPTDDIIASGKIPIPPKLPFNVPPPPCPPLFMKGSSLNDGAPDFATLGKDGAPLPKLKPLHWDKVRATPDRSMVWDKLRSSSFEFDEEMIESLFGYNLKSVFQNDEGKSKTPSPSKHVLEPKRLQNMTILSKALNVTSEQVCEALMQGEGLRLQQLEALAKMEPTKEEEAKLSNYKGNIDELGSAEKLVKAMLNIPFAFQRIEAMLYRATFEDEVVHLRNAFSMLEEACKELRSSRLFLKLLEAVLKTGNRMNVGTIRGGAKAFKLDALLKLADVKGTDGKTTLLHFVVQEIIKSQGIRMADSIMGKINRTNKTRTNEEREEDYKRMGLDLVSGLSTELCNVKKTASIDLDVLATSVSNLSDGMAKLRKLALKDLSKDSTSNNFIGAMKSFITLAEKNLCDLQEDEAKVLKSVKEITEYFHGEIGKGESNLLHIFVIVRDFLAMLDQVCRELKSLKAPNTLAPFH